MVAKVIKIQDPKAGSDPESKEEKKDEANPHGSRRTGGGNHEPAKVQPAIQPETEIPAKAEAVSVDETGPDSPEPAKGEAEEMSYKERLQRLAADFENYKKRVAKEKEGYMDTGREQLIVKLLPVLDHFDYAMESARSTSGSDAVLDGIELIRKQLWSALEQAGLEKICCTRETCFDPKVHEVVMVEETDCCEPDSILQELQCGYSFKGRVLRPTRVKLAVRPREKAKED